ncbi:hypothetical protein [Thermococcus aciditolerans]|uniref:hypothetical protein n=1 Tax=Thermococcus aciditolerans TaxID=2598455 RepID=UPI001FE355CC|nr:hypothetical protein [Thermococcus aciditolerans]
MPRVFRDERELREFLDEVLERALQKEKYSKGFGRDGRFTLGVKLDELGIHIDGIDIVEFKFELVGNEYRLVSAYPARGSKVWAYNKKKGFFIQG